MRIRLLTFLAVAMLFIPVAGWARNYDVSFKNDDIESTLNILKKATGYEFVYQKDLIKDKSFRLSGNYQDLTLEQLLNRALSLFDLSWEIVDKTVILSSIDETKFYKTRLGGIVMDELGEPLAGATVKLDNSTAATSTDLDGAFTLLVEGRNPVITVSYVGMKTKSIKVNPEKTPFIRIDMTIDPTLMNEVVVTGYQNLKRENATGAYQTITAEDMERRFTSSIAENLEGKIPGLVTTPGADGENGIVIRGVGTLQAATKPLVVVDGLPIEGGIETVNPYDIANITVLKDAAAAAIYGARASNGVIVITTKRGSSENISIDFNADVTVSEKYDYDNMGWANAAEIIELEKYNFNYMKNMPDGLIMNSLTNYYNTRKSRLSGVMRALMGNYLGEVSDADMNKTLDDYASKDYRKEWQKQFERQRVLQQYNLAMRVSGKALSSSIVLNYKTDNMGYQGENTNNLTFSYRGDLKAAKWLDMTLGVNVINTRSKMHSNRVGINSYRPWRSMYNEDGSLADMTEGVYDTLEAMQNPDYELKSMWYNPIAEKDMDYSRARRTNIRSYIQAKATILPGWTASAHFQYEDIYYKNDAYTEAETEAMRSLYNYYTGETTKLVSDYDEYWNPIQVPQRVLVHNIPYGGRLKQNTAEGAYYTFRAQTQYNRTFLDKHSIDVVGGFEYRDMHDKTSKTIYLGYDDQTQQNANTFVNYRELAELWGTASVLGPDYSMSGAPDASDFASTDILHRFYSIYFTGNYVYDSRYALSGSWRIDKTDLFGADPKFRGRPLWSVGASWNMHNESFMRPYTWIDALKPRVSYGLTGNIDSSVSSFLVATIDQNFVNAGNYATLDTPPNDQLRWEKTATWNVGIDYSFFGYRLSGSLDYYHKKGTDLLATTDLDPTTGWSMLTINNAKALNQGVEFQLNARILEAPTRNSFGVNAYFNFAYNKNKILAVNHKASTGRENLNASTFHEGYPINSLFSYDFAGFEIDESGLQHYLWRDKDGGVHNTELDDNAFRPEDCVYSGSLDPKYVSSFTPELTYRGFALSAMLSYYGGHVMRVNTDMYTSEGSEYGYMPVFLEAIPSSYLNYWRTGDTSKYVAHGYAGSNVVGKYTGQYMNTNVVPADYMKLRNIILTYTFDRNLTRHIGVNEARLRFQINNVATWTRNKADKDPEAVTAWDGTNIRKAPRSYTFSLFLNF